MVNFWITFFVSSVLDITKYEFLIHEINWKLKFIKIKLLIYLKYSLNCCVKERVLIMLTGVVSAPPTGPNINGFLIFEKNDGNL